MRSLALATHLRWTLHPGCPTPVSIGASEYRYRPELDGVRAVAILLVMIDHATGNFIGWDLAGLVGWAGVTLFFALSGYLITGILLSERTASGSIHLARFYRRRVARLAPALIVVLLFVAITGASQPGEWRLALVSSLTYSTNWVKALGVELGSLTNMWTLAVEEQFYLVWPLVLAFAFTRAHRFALVAIVIGLACYALVPWQTAKFLTPACAVALMAGSLAAMHRAELASLRPLSSLAPIGKRAYSLYLWNWPMVILLGPVIGTVATGAVAEMSYRIVERPVIRWARSRERTEAASAPA